EMGGGPAGDGTTISEEDYRYDEYKVLRVPQVNPDDDLVLVRQELNKYKPPISKYFQEIMLVEKLAETRAFTGFTRIGPPDYREYDPEDRKKLALEPQRLRWLPAIRVYGEGIFLTLRDDALAVWAKKAENRAAKLIRNEANVAAQLDRNTRILSPTFFLLH